MVTVDSTANPVRPKRKGHRQSQEERRLMRRESLEMVISGRVQPTPCVSCGSTEDLTIHHVPPLSSDRFVFLCRSCHIEVHRPLYKKVKIADSHLTLLPQALAEAQREVAPA